VISAVEQPPPICPLRSSTVVLTPDAARTIAAESPFGPEPIIVAVDIPPAFYSSRTRRSPANGRGMQLLQSENHASSSERDGINRPGTRPEHSERNAHCGHQD